ncbi:MAG: Holliday junction resolvase RuvX [Deltaproteobacteria bacterium]|nr:Holliday junction resolvase RuvX [Deltaproteobacteria bacterium]
MPDNISKKALGIDFGLKRIGLSLSDDTQTIAFPFKYIINESLKKTLSELKKIIDEENIGLIIIGMPIGLKGKQTEISVKIGEFIRELKEKTGEETEIAVYDERFSSVQAQKSLIEQNIKRKKRKEKIDSVASTFILQSYLDRQKNRQGKKIFE